MEFDEVLYEIKMYDYGGSGAEIVPVLEWVNVTSDVIKTAKCKIGLSGNGPLDRVADTGTLNFTLLNTNNKYTPGHASREYELTTGCKVRLSFTFQGRKVVKFYGYIPPDGIKINSSPWFNTIALSAVDFMELLAVHELELPEFAEDKRMDEVVALVLGNLPVQPMATEFGTGQDTFETVFDTVKTTTRALQEINKVALSEMGYVYVRPKNGSDEVLVVEGRGERNGKAFASIYTWDGNTNYLLLESGDYLLLESGDKFLLENTYTAQDALFSSNMRGLNISHADHYYNHVKTSVSPRRLGTPGEVLLNLERAVEISAGATVYLSGRFVDPDQEAQSVSGIDMIEPVATTDYLMNAAEDGTGADMTSNLTVTVTYGTNGADYVLTNTHASTTGYVTKLQARGTGVYTYRRVDHSESAPELVNTEGKHGLTLNMDYQSNPLVATDFAVFLLDQYKEKLTTIEAATFIANRTAFLMNAFLDLSVGDKVQIADSSAGIDKAFFISGLQFIVAPGGFVTYTFSLKDSVYDSFEAWILDTSELDTTTILGF